MPNTPKAPKPHHNGCGVFGEILLAVIAVVVTVVTAGAAIAALMHQAMVGKLLPDITYKGINCLTGPAYQIKEVMTFASLPQPATGIPSLEAGGDLLGLVNGHVALGIASDKYGNGAVTFTHGGGTILDTDMAKDAWRAFQSARNAMDMLHVGETFMKDYLAEAKPFSAELVVSTTTASGDTDTTTSFGQADGFSYSQGTDNTLFITRWNGPPDPRPKWGVRRPPRARPRSAPRPRSSSRW